LFLQRTSFSAGTSATINHEIAKARRYEHKADMFGIKISLPRLGALLQVADAEFEMPYIYNEKSQVSKILFSMISCKAVEESNIGSPPSANCLY